MARGILRIYLGAAPGVGKTFAMLGEAHQRRSWGTDVVVGLVESHGRRRTAERLEGLEVLPRREVTELDVDAVLARRPDAVVVDELAHTNAPGSTHRERWQDVDEILDAGIDVLTTVDIGELDGLRDVVEQITGSARAETVPDVVVRGADEVELVDVTPEALRRRLAHGDICPPERIQAALSGFFRLGNLAALRELSLLWLADRVDGSRERGVAGPVVDDSDAAGSRGWRLPPLTGALTARRRWLGALLAALGVPVLIALCLAADASLSIVLPACLLLVLAVALVGGLWPALGAAVLGGLVENWFFVPPTRQLTVHHVDDVVALLGGLVVAVAVATVVDRSARRATAAARSQAETTMLASLARSVLAGDRSLPSLLEQVREAFGLRSVTMVERTDDGERGVGTAGTPGPPGDEAESVAITDTLTLRLHGRTLPASERRVLLAFAEQAAVALQQGRLAAQAAEADRLAAGNSMRTALLAAVSHDLRTPLAGIKAAVSALRSADLELDDADRAELEATIDESADRLTDLVENLLDMSRLQAGAVRPAPNAADVPAVVDSAMRGLDGADRARVALDWPGHLPAVLADPGLLERVVANLLSNAVRHAPGGRVTVTAGTVGDRVELRVVDRGPGVPAADRERVFAPFQRLGDAPAGQGVGLGLAVARGLTEAMEGSVTAEDTPGGGLTMVVTLRTAVAPSPVPPVPAP